MTYLLGIDLGTSSVKAVLVDEKGSLLAIGQEEYVFDIPREGWAEQDPDVWWKATAVAIADALHVSCINPGDIACVGLAGQMHALVPLDQERLPVRKAIIWCDQRTMAQVEEIRRILGDERLGEIAHSPIATGFQIASLLWMKEKEPDLYEKIATVILPKDYIRLKLTGDLSTDVTDAAATLALDSDAGTWSEEIIGSLGLRRDIYPGIFMPDAIAGEVSRNAAAQTGLKAGTKVVYGGADQVMQAIGNGIIRPGEVLVNIGTGGQVVSLLSEPIYDKRLRAHSFNFVWPHSWYFLGAALSSGLSLRWFRTIVDRNLSYGEIDKEVDSVPCGSEGLLFLPYLSGERTPCMDPHARGLFFGLTLNHTRWHLMRSVMEGVAYSMRDCLDIFTDDMGQTCSDVVVSGGGARSKPWLQILADVFGRPVYTTAMKEQAGFGAAIVAGLGAGCYANYAEACAALVKRQSYVYNPISANVKRYEKYHRLFKDIYAVSRESMKTCESLSQAF